MSSNGRWSFFSKGETTNNKEEEGECKKEEQRNDNEEEVVVSEKEPVNFNVNDNSGEQEVKTIVVESSCNTENDTESTDVDALYERVNEYLKTRITKNRVNESNSHYRGANTEVMPTMPVLFIEEFIPASSSSSLYSDNKKSASVTDWRAYIYYDSFRGVYVVNGTRRRNNERGVGTERRYPDICMTFKSRSALAFYLRRSMYSRKHNLSVTLYSMYRSVIHLSTCGAMPSFHSIHNCRSKFRTELFGYDDCRVSVKEFESYLKVLKEGADDGYLFRPTNTAMTV